MVLSSLNPAARLKLRLQPSEPGPKPGYSSLKRGGRAQLCLEPRKPQKMFVPRLNHSGQPFLRMPRDLARILVVRLTQATWFLSQICWVQVAADWRQSETLISIAQNVSDFERGLHELEFTFSVGSKTMVRRRNFTHKKLQTSWSSRDFCGSIQYKQWTKSLEKYLWMKKLSMRLKEHHDVSLLLSLYEALLSSFQTGLSSLCFFLSFWNDIGKANDCQSTWLRCIYVYRSAFEKLTGLSSESSCFSNGEKLAAWTPFHSTLAPNDPCINLVRTFATVPDRLTSLKPDQIRDLRLEGEGDRYHAIMRPESVDLSQLHSHKEAMHEKKWSQVCQIENAGAVRLWFEPRSRVFGSAALFTSFEWFASLTVLCDCVLLQVVIFQLSIEVDHGVWSVGGDLDAQSEEKQQHRHHVADSQNPDSNLKRNYDESVRSTRSPSLCESLTLPNLRPRGACKDVHFWAWERSR